MLRRHFLRNLAGLAAVALTGGVAKATMKRGKKVRDVQLHGVEPYSITIDPDAAGGASTEEIYNRLKYVSRRSDTVPKLLYPNESVLSRKGIGRNAGFLKRYNDKWRDSQIRGLRSTHLIADEYSEIPKDVFRDVVAGFGKAPNKNGDVIDLTGLISGPITISSQLNREDILELGRKAPYHKFVNFPVELKAEFQDESK